MLQSPTRQFTLSSKQKIAIEQANSRWNLFTGAVRSGKTIATLLLMLKRLNNLPDGRSAIIGKTETTIMRNILDPLQDMIGTKYVSDIEGKKREATIFGKKLYCIGANDARAVKKLKGSGFQYVLGDEITTWPENFFQMLKSRIDKPGARFDGTTNPENPRHWLKRNFIDQENELDVFHMHFTLDDNPFLSDEFKRELKKEYSGIWYKRYILGEWVKAEGLIYDMYAPDRHVVEKPDLPEIKQRWVGVDYGTSHATAFVLLGLGKNGKLYVLDEYKHEGGDMATSQTDREYAEDFRDWLRNEQNEPISPRWISIDPSAKSFRLQLWRERDKHPALGKVSKADNEVLDGIRLVSSLFSSGQLKIMDSCEKTKEELTLYSWDQKAQERGEDKPLKENDHLMDALRYAIMSINESLKNKLLTAGE